MAGHQRQPEALPTKLGSSTHSLDSAADRSSQNKSVVERTSKNKGSPTSFPPPGVVARCVCPPPSLHTDIRESLRAKGSGILSQISGGQGRDTCPPSKLKMPNKRLLQPQMQPIDAFASYMAEQRYEPVEKVNGLQASMYTKAALEHGPALAAARTASINMLLAEGLNYSVTLPYQLNGGWTQVIAFSC
eukprot:TRINITY_DN38192_c0_g1_i1.p1 TRINITY_DN38192_c0_g1~~TRINITY_DN38192_c0_g1_i1.p1  ORF type:complete len:189 (-),score=28.94 TRINITY_DN38192_c0_g1_i1:132-698(-)